MNNPVVLFPGQGSQYVGMGKAFHDTVPSVRELFQEASEILEMDVARLCFEGPADVLVQTENVQPAITVVNLACLRVLGEEGFSPAAAAGHSLGEYAALFAAGVLSLPDTLRLVRARGVAMQEAADRHPGGMVAVFGLDADTLQGICAQVREAGSVEVANHNSPAQVALTGEKEALGKASELAKKAGAKLVVPLKVSGPWHSRFMAEAREKLEAVLDTCVFRSPSVPVVANVTAAPYAEEGARDLLSAQLVNPVRWVDSIRLLRGMGHELFVEAGPGKVLTGLLRDIDREVKGFHVQDPETLARFRAGANGAGD